MEDDPGSSKGRTADFDSARGGSTPSPGTKEEARQKFLKLVESLPELDCSMLAVGNDYEKYFSRSQLRRMAAQAKK